MTPESLKAGRAEMGMTQEAAAKALGLSRRGIQDYEKGLYPVPKSVALAAAAIKHNLEPLA